MPFSTFFVPPNGSGNSTLTPVSSMNSASSARELTSTAYTVVSGASLAGAKSFTATSGPGFSLMQEAVGYAQKVGVPCVFVNVQRVGPATGMPTMPGQGDIMQVKWGSTGDYTPIAFYPNGVEEAFRVTVTAFKRPSEEELAHDFLWRVHQPPRLTVGHAFDDAVGPQPGGQDPGRHDQGHRLYEGGAECRLHLRWSG